MPDDRNISRRQLLRGRFLNSLLGRVSDAVSDSLGPLASPLASQPDPPTAAPTAQSPLHHKAFPIHRPPGAIEESAFLENCTRCDACIHACPHDAIVPAPARFRHAAGTPMIDTSPASTSACRMCDDFPCIAACEPNVLRMDMPKVMATARIDIYTCLAHQNSFCSVCSEQCPVQGAIKVINGKPRIVEDTCTGCGVCHHVCPAPSNAVLLMPLADRPPPPDANEDAAEQIDA